MVDGTQKAAPESRLRTGLAAGLAGFAGVLLLVVGLFQALQGLSAIARDRLLVLTQDCMVFSPKFRDLVVRMLG